MNLVDKKIRHLLTASFDTYIKSCIEHASGDPGDVDSELIQQAFNGFKILFIERVVNVIESVEVPDKTYEMEGELIKRAYEDL
jgi:hypothetical protein